MVDSLHVDTSDLTKFARQLKESGLTSELEMDKRFAVSFDRGGELIAARARQNASFSRRIPRSIRLHRAGRAVEVIAGGPGAPDAAPLEHKGVPGTFIHPVFGHPWTVSQRAHPFLRPALIETSPVVVKGLEAELDHTYRKVFRRG